MIQRYLFLFVCLLAILPLAANSDSLLAVAINPGTPDTTKAKIYGDLSFNARFQDPEIAYKYAWLSVQSGKKSGHTPTLAQAFNDLGIVYFDKAQYDSALFFYHESEKLRLELKDAKGLGSLYNKIGIVYQTQGKYEEALNYQFKSLKEYESIGFDYGVSYAFNNIAILFFNLGENNEALKYYSKSAVIKEKLNDLDGLGGTFSNIGNIHLKTNQTRKAVDFYHLALQYIDTVKNPYYTSSTYNNLAQAYRNLNKTDSALAFAYRALDIRERNNDKKGLVTTYSMLGHMLGKDLHQFDPGRNYLEKSLALAREIGVLRDHKDVLLNLAELYSRNGQYEKAYGYLSEGKVLSDSIFTENLGRQIAEMKEKYEAEKREIENVRLQQDKQRLVKLMWTGGIVLLALAILVIVILRLRQQKLMAKRLQEAEQEKFREMLLAEEKERARIARELHDGISQLLVSAKLHVSSVDLDPAHEDLNSLETSRQLLDESLEEVRNISHSLMPGSLIRLGLAEAIRENIRRIQSSGKVEMDAHIQLERELNEEVGLAVYRIYQECLNNMLKHSGANHISVSLQDTQKSLILELVDNGKGFDTSGISQSKGIGWDNIDFRTRLIGASFRIQSQSNEGTRILVEVPLAA